MPTRFSSTFISFGTPMRKAIPFPNSRRTSAAPGKEAYHFAYAVSLAQGRLPCASPEKTMGHAEHTIHDQSQARTISLDEYWMPFTPNREFKSAPLLVVRAEGMYYLNDR